MITETASSPSFSISNIKGMALALFVLYILMIVGIFTIGFAFKGHVQI